MFRKDPYWFIGKVRIRRGRKSRDGSVGVEQWWRARRIGVSGLNARKSGE